MNPGLIRTLFVTILLGTALAGCGSGGDDGPAPFEGSASIGTEGGTVRDPSGAMVVVPAGALTTATTIGVAQSNTGAPALPSSVIASGSMFAFTPHGTLFATPVVITVPFDPASAPAGTTPTLLKTNAAQTGWEVVVGATIDGATLSGRVTGFSFATVGFVRIVEHPELTEKQWQMLAGQAFEPDPLVLDNNAQIGGEVNRREAIGAPLIVAPAGQPLPPAVLEVFSSGNGKTFWTIAEAPRPDSITPDLDASRSSLKQTFTFQRPPEAVPSLDFRITRAFMETVDSGGTAPSLAMCPWLSPTMPPEALASFCAEYMMRGSITFTLQAIKALAPEPFFSIGGTARLAGAGTTWDVHTSTPADSMFALWLRSDFTFDLSSDRRHASAQLATPFTVSVPVQGHVGDNETFTVIIEIITEATNRVQGESYAIAFLRDPLSTQGMEMSFTGLEQIPVDHSARAPAVATPCGRASDPAAGTLQFTSPVFAAPESRDGATVEVERVGGTAGAVSALLETADATAVAGSDYESVRSIVRFGDGQGGTRTVTLPLVVDRLAEPDKTVNLALSMFGGCAALGTQATAVLTIQDDDRPLPAAQTALDPAFGTAGLVTTEHFGGRNSSMALQRDGKIVMAGGSIVDFLLARYNVDGSLDTGFGDGGKVKTDIPGSFVTEEARGVAVLSDGKILVAGHIDIQARPVDDQMVLALARYNTDGSLDASFGAGGIVITNVAGRASAMLLQPDGKLVVGGRSNSNDFLLARFLVDGRSDGAFGTAGSITTDFGGRINEVKSLALQPDGSIVASGLDSATLSSEYHTDIARYDAAGHLDPTFGSGGRVTLLSKTVTEGLALQPDGKLVLVGSAPNVANPIDATDFAVMRLNANGSVDGSFGSGGTTTTVMAGERDVANAVLLLPDGRIVVGGQAGNFSDFALTRYRADGSLDTSFGLFGKLTIAFPGATSAVDNMALQADGKLVIGGSMNASFAGYALARLLP